MGARYYDAITARFLSRDPRWPQLETLHGLNPYSYARNNPTIYVDPKGKIGGGAVGKILAKYGVKQLSKKAAQRLGMEVLKQVGAKTAEEVSMLKSVEAARKSLPPEEQAREAAVDRVVSMAKKEFDALAGAPLWRDYKEFLIDIASPLVTVPAAVGGELKIIRIPGDIINIIEEEKDPGRVLAKLDKIGLGIGRGTHTYTLELLYFRTIEGGKGPKPSWGIHEKIGYEAYKAFAELYMAQKKEDIDFMICLMETIGFKSVSEMRWFYMSQEMPIANYHRVFWREVEKRWAGRVAKK